MVQVVFELLSGSCHVGMEPPLRVLVSSGVLHTTERPAARWEGFSAIDRRLEAAGTAAAFSAAATAAGRSTGDALSTSASDGLPCCCCCCCCCSAVLS